MSDRFLALLGSWWCLSTCGVMVLAPAAAAMFCGLTWLWPIALTFACLFGVGGAARDLGLATLQRDEKAP